MIVIKIPLQVFKTCLRGARSKGGRHLNAAAAPDESENLLQEASLEKNSLCSFDRVKLLGVVVYCCFVIVTVFTFLKLLETLCAIGTLRKEFIVR